MSVNTNTPPVKSPLVSDAIIFGSNVNKEKPKVKPNHRYNRDKDRELVKGIFRFHEVPGGAMEFMFKKYKEDPLEKYSFMDGGVYTVPLGVAKHLNQNCWYPVHSYIHDEKGAPTMKVNQKVKRVSFQSLEFMDIDELNPVSSLVEVTSL